MWYLEIRYSTADRALPGGATHQSTEQKIVCTGTRLFQRPRIFVSNTGVHDLDVYWPVQELIATGVEPLMSIHSLCSESGWLPSNTVFHVQHTLAKTVPYANRVQVATPFLRIVIASNIAKIFGIYLTIRMCSTGHIITSGDAVASSLKALEDFTRGNCTSTKWKTRRSVGDSDVKPWRITKKPKMFILGGTRILSFATM